MASHLRARRGPEHTASITSHVPGIVSARMTSGAYPAKLRVLDYVANDGGGLRFVAQLVKALSARGDFDVEIASHGEALDNYRRAFAAQSDIRVLDLKPERFFLSRGFVGFRGATRLNSMMHLDRFYFEVPLAAWAGCDVLWLPWIHRHRIPRTRPRHLPPCTTSSSCSFAASFGSAGARTNTRRCEDGSTRLRALRSARSRRRTR